ADALQSLGAPADVAAPASERVAHAPPRPAVSRGCIGIDWQLRSDSGWGVYGTNLALELGRRVGIMPRVAAVDLGSLARESADELRPILAASADLMNRLRTPGDSVVDFDGVMLRALGNNFACADHTRR